MGSFSTTYVGVPSNIFHKFHISGEGGGDSDIVYAKIKRHRQDSNLRR